MGCEAQSKPRYLMAVETFDRAKQRADFLSVGDRGKVLDLGRGKRVTQACCQIVFGAPGGDRVAKDAPAYAPQPSGALVSTASLDFA